MCHWLKTLSFVLHVRAFVSIYIAETGVVTVGETGLSTGGPIGASVWGKVGQ
jgi:hypothetical protein